MTKILLGDLVGDMRGSTGSTTYSRNTFANYRRNKTSPVNPNTVSQQLVRARFGAFAQAWGGLTENLRQSWIDVAAAWTNTNVFNQEIGYTGFSLFGRLNRNRQEINQALLTAAPLPQAVPAVDTLSIVADTTGGTLNATFTPVVPATQEWVVRATHPVSAGTTFVKQQFRKIAVLSFGDLSPFDLASFYIAVFGALPPVGAKVFVDFKPVQTANGQDGVPLKDSDIAV